MLRASKALAQIHPNVFELVKVGARRKVCMIKGPRHAFLAGLVATRWLAASF